MSLEQAILAWDGKSADDVEAIYLRYQGVSGFAASAVELTRRRDLETGATWLLKRHLQLGGRLSAAETTQLLDLAPALQAWEARLHLLQSLLYLRIGDTERDKVEAFLRRSLQDDNKFVRAWAYGGFHELAKQYPEYRAEAEQLFELALRDEAPSVKARIRNVKKQGF